MSRYSVSETSTVARPDWFRGYKSFTRFEIFFYEFCVIRVMVAYLVFAILYIIRFNDIYDSVLISLIFPNRSSRGILFKMHITVLAS